MGKKLGLDQEYEQVVNETTGNRSDTQNAESGPMAMKKAGFFQRVVAFLIDSFIFGAIGGGTHNFGLSALWVLYETILVSNWNGHTIGKKIMGIRVTTVSGENLDWVKALVRACSKVLSLAALCIGCLWMIWDEKSQTWHDKIADTFVGNG